MTHVLEFFTFTYFLYSHILSDWIKCLAPAQMWESLDITSISSYIFYSLTHWSDISPSTYNVPLTHPPHQVHSALFCIINTLCPLFPQCFGSNSASTWSAFPLLFFLKIISYKEQLHQKRSQILSLSPSHFLHLCHLLCSQCMWGLHYSIPILPHVTVICVHGLDYITLHIP